MSSTSPPPSTPVANQPKPHVEVFAVGFVFGRQWGYQCFTCGFEYSVTDFLTAEEHAETHRCEVLDA